MMVEQNLPATISEIDKVITNIPNISTIPDARKLVALAQGYIVSARKLYNFSEINTIGEVSEDKQRTSEIAKKSGELRLFAEARLGELIKQEQEAGRLASQSSGNRSLSRSVATLRDYGLTKDDSSRAQELAEHKDIIAKVVVESLDIPTREAVEREIKKQEGKAHVGFATGESEWYTPSEYIESARLTMGSIDIDPASSDIANRIVKAKQYFTIEDDGRTKPWTGNVWMNPPYTQPLVKDFTSLLVEKYLSKEIAQACVLVNNATETGFYQAMLQVCQMVCFIKGRVTFIDRDGNASGAPLQGQTILYFGPNQVKFGELFSLFGVILYART